MSTRPTHRQRRGKGTYKYYLDMVEILKKKFDWEEELREISQILAEAERNRRKEQQHRPLFDRKYG